MKSVTTVLRWTLLALVGIAAGVASAWWATGGNMIQPLAGHPAWRSSLAIGSSAADPYTRARVARTGLLALNRSEAVYYLAHSDHAGRRLRATCRYRVSGVPLPGRWWSLTLYAADQFLAKNKDHAHVVSSDNVKLRADGTWSVRVAATRADAANWLSTRRSGDFSLVVRIYQPSAAVVEGKEPELPVVRRVACEPEGDR